MAGSALPPNVLLDVTLTIGAVYYFINPDPQFSSEEPHYFVVVSDPDDDGTVLLCATSEVGKVQSFVYTRDLPPETVVVVTPAEYAVFTKQTIFNCNNPFLYTRAYLEQIISDKKMLKASLPTMPEEILTKLQGGITASPMVEPVIQNLIKEPVD